MQIGPTDGGLPAAAVEGDHEGDDLLDRAVVPQLPADLLEPPVRALVLRNRVRQQRPLRLTSVVSPVRELDLRKSIPAHLGCNQFLIALLPDLLLHHRVHALVPAVEGMQLA